MDDWWDFYSASDEGDDNYCDLDCTICFPGA